MLTLSIFVEETMNHQTRDENGSHLNTKRREYKERKDRDLNIEPGIKREEGVVELRETQFHYHSPKSKEQATNKTVSCRGVDED